MKAFIVTNLVLLLISFSAESVEEVQSFEQIKTDILGKKKPPEGENEDDAEDTKTFSEEFYIEMLSREYTLTHLSRIKDLDLHRILIESDYNTLYKQFEEIDQLVKGLEASKVVDVYSYQHLVKRLEMASELLNEHTARMEDLNDTFLEGFCSENTLLQTTPKVTLEKAIENQKKKRKPEEGRVEENPLDRYKKHLSKANNLIEDVLKALEKLTKKGINGQSLPTGRQRSLLQNEVSTKLTLLNNMGFDLPVGKKGVALVSKLIDYKKDIDGLNQHLKGLDSKYSIEKRQAESYELNKEACLKVNNSLGVHVYENTNASFLSMNTTSHESSVATSLSINSFEERLSDLNIAIDSYMKSYSDKDIVQKLRNQISNDTTNNRFARSIVYDYYREKEEETSRVKGLDDVKNKYSNIKYLTVIGVLLRKAFPRHTGKYKDEMSKDYKILKRLLFDDTIQMNRTSMIKLRDLAISKKLPLKVSSEYKDEFVEGYHTYEMTTDNFSREFYKKRQSSDYMPKGRLDIEFVAKTKNTSVFNEGAEEPEEDIGPLRKFVQDIGTEAQYILDRLLLNKDLFIGNGRGVNTKPSEVEVLNSNAKLFMSCLKNKGEVLANQIFKQSVKYKTWKGLEEGEFFSQRSHVECNSEFQFNLVTQFLLARLIPYLTDEEKSLVYQKIVLGEEIDFNESFNLLEK